LNWNFSQIDPIKLSDLGYIFREDKVLQHTSLSEIHSFDSSVIKLLSDQEPNGSNISVNESLNFLPPIKAGEIIFSPFSDVVLNIDKSTGLFTLHDAELGGSILGQGDILMSSN
jgi:hypothetical protein